MEQDRKISDVMEPETILKNETNLYFKMIKTKTLLTVATLCLLLFSKTLNAQITLEHTFDGYVSHNGAFFTSSVNHYNYFNSATSQVKLYNEDYSLYKSITITLPTNYSMSGIYLISKGIVTTDNKTTFFVQATNVDMISTNPNLYSCLILYDENGAIIKDFGYAYIFSPSFHKLSNNTCRLSIIRYIYSSPSTYQTDIYSLPGILPTPPIITTTTLPNGTVGAEYNVTLTATGTTPIAWSLESGNLPNGLNLSSTGIISGIPTVEETFDFAVRAANVAGSGKKELFIVIDEKTGISTLQIAEMKIYPNPTNGKLFVECGDSIQSRIIFYDITGKDVINQNITGKTEINIDNLQKGVYVVTVVSENEVIGNFKIVKQ